MRRNSSASMFGGYALRGHRIAVVSSWYVHRYVLVNETETDSAPVAAAALPVGLEDDKEKLRGLNNRLTIYLETVTNLNLTNEHLRKQIDEILAKRQHPKGRGWDDWDKFQKTFEDPRIKIKDITMDNNRLFREANRFKLAIDDYKKKFDGEIAAHEALKKELDKTKNALEEFKQLKESMKKETKTVKDEIDRIKQEHKDMVADLCVEIRAAKVTVEIEPGKNSLTSTIDNMRRQYEKIAEKNRKETEDFYRKEFEQIKVKMNQNTQKLESLDADLKHKQNQKQQMEITVQAMMTKIQTQKILLENTKRECSKRLGSVNNVVQKIESELKKARAEMERQSEIQENLKYDNRRLKEEIRKYNDLMNTCSAERKVEA